MRTLIVLVIILVVPSIVLSGNLYKWRDSNGKLHITDYAPPFSAKEITVKPFTKYTESPAQIAAQNQHKRYEDQASERDYQIIQNNHAVSKYNKQIEAIHKYNYENKKIRLETSIKKWDSSYTIKDSKKWRDHCRQQRDFYKEKLKILKRYN